MDFRRRARLQLVALAVFAATASFGGCRQNNASRELLERELRLQEDRIYQLEAKLEDAERALSQVRDCASPRNGSWSNERLGSGPSTNYAAPPSTITPSPSVTLPEPSSPSPLAPPSVTLPPAVEMPSGGSSSNSSAPAYRGPPLVVPVDPSIPEGIPARPAAPPSASSPNGASANPGLPPLKPMSSPKFLPPSRKPTIPDRTETGAALPTVPQSSSAAVRNGGGDVRSITLGRRTGGLQLDAAPGDDGVLVVVEARNARGEASAVRAAASLVLIDPAIPGEGGRYARWDVEADDVAALFRPQSGDDEAGIYFELPWPDAPPTHTRLKLFVRLMIDDGRQLQTECDLTLELGATTARAPSVSGGPSNSGPIVTANANVSAEHRTAAVPVASEPLRWGRPTADDVVPAAPHELPLPIRDAEDAAGPLLMPAQR